MHLRFSLFGAYDAGEMRHPQEVMRELGITYQHATPQTMGDQWWFWNCRNMPDPLPAYLTILNVTPTSAIGYGLSQQDADNINACEAFSQ